MNTRQKGRRAELEAKAVLEKQGYIVQLVDMPRKWSKQQDFFGLFDIIAIRGFNIKFIQVKTNMKPKLDPFIEWKREHGNMYTYVEVWIRKDRGGWLVHAA